MSQPTTGQAIPQFRCLFRSLVLDPALLYAQVVTAEIVAQVVLQEVGQTDDRIFTPLVTLTTFLFQILSDDHARGFEGTDRVFILNKNSVCPQRLPLVTEGLSRRGAHWVYLEEPGLLSVVIGVRTGMETLISSSPVPRPCTF